ncbi:MAG: Ig-like domain-containing protein [candidate division WOR-3 bacterium]
MKRALILGIVVGLVFVGCGDKEPPQVSITQPASGDTVGGTVTITAEATDNKGVTEVEFYIDNILVSTDQSSPYSHSWNTTTLQDNSQHNIYAKAFDKANNEGTSEIITVIVINAPNTPATPWGPSSGYQGSQYSYEFYTYATDPAGQGVAIRFAWGDGDTSNWSSYQVSGDTIAMEHSYLSTGTFNVTAQAKDVNGATSGWSGAHQITITTGSSQAPYAPTITGPTSGNPNVSYDFNATTTDPDNDLISIRFYWGDGDTSEWSGYVSSGSTITMSHSYSNTGTYNITAQARDIHGLRSSWSSPHQIVIYTGTNNPPNTPTITGPTSGYVTVVQTFSATTTDPDGQNISIRFAWGDGDTSSWSSYVPSGGTVQDTHTYTSTGTYSVRAQARDVQGATSNWSSPHSINITEGIVITRPNGGETYLSDEYLPIHWNWYGSFSTVKIDYSTDGGTSWTTIVSNTDNDGCYHWLAAYTSTTYPNCRIRVSHSTNPNIYDISDANFTIARDTITVVMPNGGENYYVGNYYPVHWDWTGNFSTASIDYSTDNGTSWTSVISSTTNDGCYAWDVANAPSTTALVRVKNQSDVNLNDVSNSVFTIARPAFTVKRPNGGEIYRSGEHYPIHWEWVGGVSSVNIQYSTDGGTIWTNIVTGATNDGSYTWTVPNLNSTNCRIRVVSSQDPNAYDISDNNFTITTTQVSDSIQVTSPMLNDNWIQGGDYYITWTGTYSGTVRIDYSTDGGSSWNQITSSTTGGYYLWSISGNFASNNCKIKVTSTSNPSNYDESDIFTINLQTITITSPKTSDIWLSGRDYYITWYWNGEFSTARIDYSTDGGSTWNQITSATTNDGYYRWQLTDAINGNNCKIRVGVANTTNYGVSNTFTIAPQTIKVTSPLNGDIWYAGRSYYITWDWTGDFSNARIDYSTDGGATWNQIAANAGNYGYYLWTVPNVSSTNCRIRIANTQNTNAYGLSQTFEIRSGGKIRRR